MKKKTISLILAATLILSLTACGGEKTVEVNPTDMGTILSNISTMEEGNHTLRATITVSGSDNQSAAVAAQEILSGFSLGILGVDDLDITGTGEVFSVDEVNNTGAGTGSVEIKHSGLTYIKAYYQGNVGYINTDYVLSNLKADNIEQIAEALDGYEYTEMSQDDTKLSELISFDSNILTVLGSNANISMNTSNGQEVYTVEADPSTASELISRTPLGHDSSFANSEISYTMQVTPGNNSYSVVVTVSNGDISVTSNINISNQVSDVAMPNDSMIATADKIEVGKDYQESYDGMELGEPDFVGENFCEYVGFVEFAPTDYSNYLIPTERFTDEAAALDWFESNYLGLENALELEGIFDDISINASTTITLSAQIFGDNPEMYQLTLDPTGYQAVSYSLSTEVAGLSMSDEFVANAISRIQKYTGIVVSSELVKAMEGVCAESGLDTYSVQIGTEDGRYSFMIGAEGLQSGGENIEWSIMGIYTVS